MTPIPKAYFSSDFARALELAQETLAADAGDFEALYVTGLLALRAGREQSAARLIEGAEQRHPPVCHFDFMWALQQRQGASGQLLYWEGRLRTFLEFQSVDAFLISYPKCGRTWLRLMLGHYMLNGEAGDPLELLRLAAIRPGLPRLSISHDDYPHWKPVDEIVADKAAYRGKRVVFLVRDPRDVIVSNYFQHRKRGDSELANDSFDGSLADFIRHPIGGIPTIVKFYNVWAASQGVPESFLLRRYEDYHAAPRAPFQALLQSLTLPELGPAALDNAVAYGKFDNMRRLEETNALNNARLMAPEDGDPEGFKTHKG